MFFQRKIASEQLAGLAIVIALHAAALYGLWHYRILVVPDEVVTLFVNTIAPPLAQAPQQAVTPPKPKPMRTEKPRPAEKPPPSRQRVAEAPVTAPAEPVAPPPPRIEAPPQPPVEAPPAKPAGPVALNGELAVACPERGEPVYPPLSRRLSEEGKVVLRVELDAQGKISSVSVATSSGFPRLDEAALAAVRTWRCNPARRDGQPVRAMALQPFKFVLQGH